jgi:hypothetical protein
MAARTARAEPTRVLVPAVVVFSLDALAATGLTELAADHLGFESLAAVAILACSTLGLTLFSGLLEQLVGAVERGLDPPRVHEVVRDLPWGRLLVADGILWGLSSLASLAFVVPGMVVATLGMLVGPLITMRECTVPEAFRTSVRLVWPNFWWALCLVTLPLGVENDVVTLVKVVVPHERAVLVFASHLGLGLLFGVTLGLVEVTLAESLVHDAQGPAKHLRSATALTDDLGVEFRHSEGGPHGRDDPRHDDAGPGDQPPAG